MIEIISATRLSENDFWNKSALGISLRRLAHDARLVARLAFSNRRGLSDIFNARISAPDGHDLLVFIHDDVEITDFFWTDHIRRGLIKHAMIGLAGNTVRKPMQQSWAFLDEDYERCETLSGTIGHDGLSGRYQNYFGESFKEVKLLDGVMLACDSSVLAYKGITFDERFDFHYYDMDICRQFERAGLTMGTWGISMVHSSPGRYLTPEWKAAQAKYFEKWGS